LRNWVVELTMSGRDWVVKLRILLTLAHGQRDE
jgi:hypothetical protein